MRARYDREFYNRQREISRSSSEAILDVVFAAFGVPDSMIDVGCGVGEWLTTARTLGVKSTVGIDGNWVRQENLIPDFVEFFEKDLTLPFNLGRTFDVAICVEVAEHLPESSADGLIKSLTSHADIIVFSAAVPGQGGVGHVNERWQSFWANKFQQRGLLALDIVRPLLWNNDGVGVAYRQNCIVYAKSPPPPNSTALFSSAKYSMTDVIHPVVLRRIIDRYEDRRARPRSVGHDLVTSLLGMSKPIIPLS